MRIPLFLWMLLLTVPSVGLGQSYEELAMRYRQPQLYHEAMLLPDPAQTTLVVAFRVPNTMLVFVRNRQGGSGRAFVAQPWVMVQLLRDGRRVAEKVWQPPHYAATFEETQQKDVDLEGTLQFEVAPGAYTYRLWLKDEQTGQEQAPLSRSFTVRDGGGLHISAPLMARAVQVSETNVRLGLVNLGGDVPYGEGVHAMLPVMLPDSLQGREGSLRYAVRYLGAGQTGSMKGDVATEGVIDGSAWLPVWAAAEALWDGGTVQWPLAVSPDPTVGYLVPVDLQGEQLADGAYVLEATLTVGRVVTTERYRFNTHWRSMPLSLYHADVALRNLRFIEERQTIKALRKGTQEEQEARLRAYWKERDPTPGTPFNELMAEFYRRVDDAAEMFRTARVPVPDGLRTDQASVYIVHGPPRDTERTFPDSGGVRETWTYADGRRFSFWAATSLDPFHLER